MRKCVPTQRTLWTLCLMPAGQSAAQSSFSGPPPPSPPRVTPSPNSMRTPTHASAHTRAGPPARTAAIQTIQVKDPNGASVSLYALNTVKGVLVWYPASAGQTLPWGSTQASTGMAASLSVSLFIDFCSTAARHTAACLW